VRRRELIAALGGAALSPFVAHAQQRAVPVVGFLRSAAAAGSTYLVAAFRQGLKEAGFTEGQNVAVEYRWADDRNDRLPELAADLVRRKAAVIVANPEGARAAKAASTTIPIVFATGGDPVALGLVGSFNRPAGNVTGVVFFFAVLGAKRLELLRQLVPRATTIAMLANPHSPNIEGERSDVQAVTQAARQELVMLDASSDHDIETAFATFIERRADALLVGSGAFLNSHRGQIVALAARHGLPAIYAQREAALDGGLMSYGPSISDAYRQAGIYAGRILKGEKPGDLPVIRSTKFDFVINLKTARMLGLEIPPTLLALADEVIE
jgi:putative ABC transport system substrate-binding protein